MLALAVPKKYCWYSSCNVLHYDKGNARTTGVDFTKRCNAGTTLMLGEGYSWEARTFSFPLLQVCSWISCDINIQSRCSQPLPHPLFPIMCPVSQAYSW